MRLVRNTDTKGWDLITTSVVEPVENKYECNLLKDGSFDSNERYTLNYKFENSDHVHGPILEISGEELLSKGMSCLNTFFRHENNINNIRNVCSEFFGLFSIRNISKSKFDEVKKDYNPDKVELVEKGYQENIPVENSDGEIVSVSEIVMEYLLHMMCCYFLIKLLTREGVPEKTNTLTVIDSPRSDVGNIKNWKDQPITKRLNLSFKEFKEMWSMGCLRYEWSVS